MNVLENIIIRGLYFLILGFIVYILTIKLRFKYNGWNLNNPRKHALYALAAICTSIFLITIILFFSNFAHKSTTTKVQMNIIYTFSSVLSIAFSYLIFMSPILLTKKFFKQSWASTGVSKHNLKKSISIGIIVGVIYLIIFLLYMNINIIKVMTHLNSSHFWGLLYFSIVGFCEEFMFRGYLQTRLIAYVGKNKGWIISSVLMVLMHLPQRIFINGLSLSESFMSMLYLIFFSLFLGYTMIKTENVTAPAIFHTLYDWGNILA